MNCSVGRSRPDAPLYPKKTSGNTTRFRKRNLARRAPTLSVQNPKKEVFQPHLPVRLPCYDLAPVTTFALGRSSRSRTSGARGFHGLTGGVYKARERIHRAMADARLLANPTSWSRVADSSPNWDGFSRSASRRRVFPSAAGLSFGRRVAAELVEAPVSSWSKHPPRPCGKQRYYLKVRIPPR